LIPSEAKEASIGYEMINARSETVATKPAFKRLIGKRHCLVLANGFFERRKEGKKQFPMHFKLKSGEIFTFPGLWDSWKQPDGNILHTYTLLTTTPNELVKPIHDRMPVSAPVPRTSETVPRRTNGSLRGLVTCEQSA
jgi:putative SOS response-associated peptidase YedK